MTDGTEEALRRAVLRRASCARTARVPHEAGESRTCAGFPRSGCTNIGFRLLAEAGWTQQRIADHHGMDKAGESCDDGSARTPPAGLSASQRVVGVAIGMRERGLWDDEQGKRKYGAVNPDIHLGHRRHRNGR